MPVDAYESLYRMCYWDKEPDARLCLEMCGRQASVIRSKHEAVRKDADSQADSIAVRDVIKTSNCIVMFAALFPCFPSCPHSRS